MTPAPELAEQCRPHSGELCADSKVAQGDAMDFQDHQITAIKTMVFVRHARRIPRNRVVTMKTRQPL